MDEPLECVAFLLIRDGEVLAERRSQTKTVMPGILAIPGGHLEPGEIVPDALRRELHEELGLVPVDVFYICTLQHNAAEWRILHYFAVTSWTGTLDVQEADSVEWVPLSDPAALDLDVDRLAVSEYSRLYVSG